MFAPSLRRLVTLPPVPAGVVAPIASSYKGPSKDDVKHRRQRYLHPVHNHLYGDDPVMLVQGARQYVWDEAGTRYLDMFGGVATVFVGHSHPRITALVREQAALINHTCILYLNPHVVDFCELLAKKLNQGNKEEDEEWVVNVVSSGSEANDFAMLAARVATGNQAYCTLRNGYHGYTEGSRNMITVPGWKYAQLNNGGLLRFPCPHPYRGIFGCPDPADPASVAALTDRYVDEAEMILRTETGGALAGFLAERIQGVGGTVPLLPGYLRQIAGLVRKHGGLYVADEVQCGFGRLGTHYWGFETEGIRPDIVTMAKSVANGWSVGVCAMRKSIGEKMKGVGYFNTFGGTAINAMVASETIKIIDDEGLQENSRVVGGRLMTGLKEVQSEFPHIIGDVRGMGFLQAAEIIAPQKNHRGVHDDRFPSPERAVQIMNGLRHEGILVGKGGTFGNCVRFHPPMCITAEDADATVQALRNVLKKLQL